MGGGVKLLSELDEGLTQEKDDFRVSGFPNEEAAINFFNSKSDQLNPLSDLARELGEELGLEELDLLIKKGFQVEGANVSNTSITSLISSITQTPDTHFFPLEISRRTGKLSLRVLIAYKYEMGNNKELDKFIRENSSSISDFLNSDSDFPPKIFLRITKDEIKDIHQRKKNGESYEISHNNHFVLIGDQVDIL